MKFAFIESIPEYGIQEKLAEEGHEIIIILKTYLEDEIEGCGAEDSNNLTSLNTFQVDFFKYKEDKELQTYLNENPEIILFRNSSVGHTFTAKHVIGSSPFTASLELDRFKGEELARNFKFKVPKTTTSIEEAIKFKGEKILIKSLNSEDIPAYSIKTVLVYKEDLEYLKTTNLSNCLFQEFIEGDEIAFGGYYSGSRFIEPYTFIQEYKQAYSNINNLIMTGESGSCGEYTDNLPLVFYNILKEHEPFIKGHRGFFDINTLISKEGDIYFLEYTPRMGFPTEYETIALLDIPYSKFINCILNNEDYSVRNRYFSSAKITALTEAPFVITCPETDKFIATNVSCNRLSKDRWLYPNFREDLLIVTGLGDSVKECSKNLYEGLSNVKGYGIYYLDKGIGDRWVW